LFRSIDLFFTEICVILMLIITVKSFKKYKFSFKSIVMLLMMVIGIAGSILHVYKIGSFEFDAWGILNNTYHFGEPFSNPGFEYYLLTAFNNHGIAFPFPEEYNNLFLMFGQSTELWHVASFITITVSLILNLSILLGKFLNRYRKLIMLLMMIIPILITTWLMIMFAQYPLLFIIYSLYSCLISYMLIAFPFMYYVLNKQNNKIK